MAAAMGAAASKSSAAGGKQKNVLGLDFEIPEELSQILAQELRNQASGGNEH